MTCPFYVGGRHPCALGEPDGRHCGPRQYPVCVCNLDEIGRGEAWRAVLAQVNAYTRYAVLIEPKNAGHELGARGGSLIAGHIYLDAAGWSP